jgi:threonine aldolase
MIDLRSDTVTKPSPEMRKAMANAEVGDDVLDGDPTTRRLEERVADILGKEDALFFPTGTMANQAGIWLDTKPGTELLLEANAHLVHYEIAGVAGLAGVQIRPIATPGGLLTPDLVRAAVRAPSKHVPRPSAIAVENTHNFAGGVVMPVDALRGIRAVADELKVPLHLDGARLWNAAAALGVKPAQVAGPAHTVFVAFSKCLGAPVGSALAFPKAAHQDVWEIRKRLGGGMRQSGIIAAGALYGLEHNLGRIAEDHDKAKRIAHAFQGHPRVRPVKPDSNIVMMDLLGEQDDAALLADKLWRAGVGVSDFGPKRLRAVTHMDVSDAEVNTAIEIMERELAA